MPALRPGNEFSNKTNINPSVNRQTEATAEDFVENAAILNDHADRIDTVYHEQYRADFYGFFGSLALVASTFPDAPEDSFAVLMQNNEPKSIAKVVGGVWTEQQNEASILYYATRLDFPATGQPDVWYIAKDSKSGYLWYNNDYQPYGAPGENGASAYEIAVQYGFSGTEEQWMGILSLPTVYYNQFLYAEAATLNDFTFLTERFYVLKALDTSKLYFAAKTPHKEDFDDSQIYLEPNKQYFDLETMDTNLLGYDLWLLESVTDWERDSVTPYFFQFWLKKSGIDQSFFVGIYTDLGTTRYASATELIAAGYKAAEGFLQSSQVFVPSATGGFVSYFKRTDTDTDWLVFDNVNGWQTLPV